MSKKSTLYLTDLDGTLLNSDAKLSKNSKDILNTATKNGCLFSVATARTFSSVLNIFESVKLNSPLVLMNGVCIFSPLTNQILDFHEIKLDACKDVLSLLSSFGLFPLLYFQNGEKILIEYKVLATKSQEDYVFSRQKLFSKEFKKVSEYSLDGKKPVVYMVLLDKKENLSTVFELLSKNPDITVNFYPDNYRDEYFLEIFARGVSKASGAKRLKELLGVKEIVAFGDNFNDLPLLRLADRSYVVENGQDEVKKFATGVIGKNDDDAVAKFILDDYLKEN